MAERQGSKRYRWWPASVSNARLQKAADIWNWEVGSKAENADALLGDLVNFAEQPFNTPKAVAVAKRLMFALLGWGRWWARPIGHATWLDAVDSPAGRDAAVALHAEVGRRLHGWRAMQLQPLSHTWATRGTPAEFEIPHLALSLEFGALPQRRGRGAKFMAPTVRGPLRDVLLFKAMELLTEGGFDRVLQCECGRLFAKNGRREYCSARCQKRVYMRTYIPRQN